MLLAGLLSPLLIAAGVDVTPPMQIISRRNEHCGAGATSDSIRAVAGSLDAWVRQVQLQPLQPKTWARVNFLAAVVFYILWRTLLWEHGVTARRGPPAPLVVDGVAYTLPAGQTAAFSWYAAVSGRYPHGNDNTQTFSVREIVTRKCEAVASKAEAALLMQAWRGYADGALEIHVPEAARPVVSAVLDTLAVSSSHRDATAQASRGPRTRLFAHAAFSHAKGSPHATAFRIQHTTLQTIDGLYSCDLAAT